jgi:hypothetical protein
VQWGAPQGSNGLWKPIRLSNGSYQFQNLNSGKCLDVPGWSTTPDTQLQQWDCHNPAEGSNQAFAAFVPGHAVFVPKINYLSDAYPWNTDPEIPTWTLGSQVTVHGTNFGSSRGSGYIHLWFTPDNPNSCVPDKTTINWGEPGNGARFTVYSWSNNQVVFQFPTPSGPGDSGDKYQIGPNGTGCVAIYNSSGKWSNTATFQYTGGDVINASGNTLYSVNNFRTGPGTSFPVNWTSGINQWVPIICYITNGESVNGYSVWDQTVSHNWIWDGLLDTPPGGPTSDPKCSNAPPDL